MDISYKANKNVNNFLKCTNTQIMFYQKVQFIVECGCTPQ